MRTTTTIRSASGRPVRRTAATLRGFTLVELLVVIGIIGLLVGLLLPALGKVIQRSKSTATMGTAQEFAKACDAYFQEFGEYPAAVPDEALYAGLNGDNNLPQITAAENALLALMGGYRIATETSAADYTAFGGTELIFSGVTPSFKIRIDANKMGEGPFKNGKKYDAFYSPKGREFSKAAGQLGADGQPEAAGAGLVPDLVDAWGAPMIFIKQQRGIGPLVKNGNNPGQFERSGMLAYTGTTQLGDTSTDQTDTLKGSVLNTNSAGSETGAGARDLTMGQLIRHAGINAQSSSGSASVADKDKVRSGTARGKYFIISAGTDGIFFSRAQATNSTGAAMTDIVSTSMNPAGPQVVERYDDVIVAGGS